ncbi:hypothetical protein NX784_27450 [Massilia pinisoli]|uniref:Uncharacterized protein n=1 Tax=Massilia pinisoli TaxID=1772194 RepID=A0ABT1ZZH5_9BURK|nr:hypothetical protein [Massilia pinisoli]MCS0585321.1 hypothetical protein [Massilia pinisoli]
MVHARRGLSATHPIGSDFIICYPGYRTMLPTGHNYSSANSKNSVDRELQQFLLKAKNRLERIARSTGSGARATDLYGEVWIAVCTLRERLNRELDLFQSEDEDRIFSFVYSRLRRQTDWKLHFADRLDFDDGEGLRLSERLGDSRPDEACEQAENYNALACTYSQAFAYIVALSNFRNELALLANHLAITLPTLRARMRNLNKQARTQPSLFDRKQRMDENFVPLPGRQIRSLLKTPVMDGEHATLF